MFFMMSMMGVFEDWEKVTVGVRCDEKVLVLPRQRQELQKPLLASSSVLT